MKKIIPPKDEIEFKPTESKQLKEKEYKEHLREMGIDNEKINEIWERIKRGRK